MTAGRVYHRYMNGSLKALVIAIFLAFPATFAAAGEKPLTVVELFTSQGCSSCPPADAYLGKLAERSDILALSIHVDYWDYIGWKDTFAKPEYGTRQRKYAQKLGLGYVYTPQMVIQGMAHTTGSDKDTVERLIGDLKGLKRLDVTALREGDSFNVTVPAGDPEEAKVLFVTYDARHDTVIRRGENSGHTLSYYNVVRELSEIGRWTGEAAKIPVPDASARLAGHDGGAVLVQSKKTGRILGAVKLRPAPAS